jgi:putative flippase GtrA
MRPLLVIRLLWVLGVGLPFRWPLFTGAGARGESKGRSWGIPPGGIIFGEGLRTSGWFITDFCPNGMKLLFNKSTFRQFAIYVVIGGTATGVDWLFFYFLNVRGGFSYLSAVVLSFSLGAMINYLLNKFITFKDQTRQIIAQIGLYGLICAIALVCSVLLMFVLVEWAKLWPMLARVVASGIMLLFNFLAHKYITYNQQVYLHFTKSTL